MGQQNYRFGDLNRWLFGYGTHEEADRLRERCTNCGAARWTKAVIER